MRYDITWNHLDKKKNIVNTYANKPCFAKLRYKEEYKDTKYIEFLLLNSEVSDKNMLAYFKWIRSIPAFKPLFLQTPQEMVDSKTCLVDVSKHNGLQVISFLTVIRAVLEDTVIANTIAEFKPRKVYPYSKLDILRIVGSVLKQNSGHWLTRNITRKSIGLDINTDDRWMDTTPCNSTGVIFEINNTFEGIGGGLYVADPFSQKDITKLLGEKKKVPKNNLQLNF